MFVYTPLGGKKVSVEGIPIPVEGYPSASRDPELDKWVGTLITVEETSTLRVKSGTENLPEVSEADLNPPDDDPDLGNLDEVTLMTEEEAKGMDFKALKLYASQFGITGRGAGTVITKLKEAGKLR